MNTLNITPRSMTAIGVGLFTAGALAIGAMAGESSALPEGFDEARVAQIMTDAGYTFEEAGFEDGRIEAEGMKDGQEWEVTISAETGEILSATPENAPLPEGFDEARVAQIMTDAGYTFEEAEFEDGRIEAEGIKEGQEWEVTISAETGEILTAELDD